MVDPRAHTTRPAVPIVHPVLQTGWSMVTSAGGAHTMFAFDLSVSLLLGLETWWGLATD